ncbi:hemin-degrading factor [Alcanivorax sp. JB21]|uniref:hemin-degrading factor n=1 Tax=Alcanivorax limicola TaxID=2874102 RepID=UPI001CBB490E|nr:ChuX/HutX family heme-like substrate-binding protein [Alcanivorax limicola]MBZ2188548.1 hemin-degrading factor [Alcanivorax limicola]
MTHTATQETTQATATRASEQRDALQSAWRALRETQPRLRIRNAAAMLGVSELELLLTEPEDVVIRLQPAFTEIYPSLSLLGRIMTLARNDEVVHETTGQMSKFSVMEGGRMGLCLGEIDLRVFFSHWGHACAVTEAGPKGPRHSLQMFDHSGQAVHKVYATGETDMAAWAALVARFRAADADQRPALALQPAPVFHRKPSLPDPQPLRDEWAAITDVHQFHDMLRRHGLDRLTALQQVGEPWARPVAQGSIESVLNSVAEIGTPIMAFVGNRGIVQIYTGRVHRLLSTGEWFNVLDPHFNLHMRTGEMTQVWVVRRPSEDGDITSLDAFNADGELVLSLFGERKPGKAELPAWRDLLAQIETAS